LNTIVNKLIFKILIAIISFFYTSSIQSSEISSPPENRKVRIHKIHFSGLETLGSNDILSVVELEEGESYPIGFLEFFGDTLIKKLRGELNKPFAQILEYDRKYGKDSSYVELNFIIDEGHSAIVDTVMIYGPLGGRQSEVFDKLRTHQGELFDPRRWDGDMETSLEYFESQGHPFVQILTYPLEPDFRSGKVGLNLGMKINPGRVVTLERVEIAGLTKTRPKTAGRALGLEPGIRFDPVVNSRAGRRLERTGWFSEVSQPRLFHDNYGAYGIVYEVQEQSTSTVTGALGYVPRQESGGELAGNLDARFSNLLGTGREFSLNWRRDSDSQSSFALGYMEPWLFGKPLDLNLGFSQEVIESLYVALEYEAGLTLRMGDFWSLGGAGQQRFVSADSAASGIDSLSYNLTGVRAFLSMDSRDYPDNPSTGSRWIIRSSRYSASKKAEFDVLYKNSFEFEKAIELRPSLVGFSGLHYEETKVESETVPPAEWVRIGGASTVRGFAERSLSAPRAGWINLELRQLTGRDSRVFLLSDIAVLEIPVETVWEFSYGGGVLVNTAAGLITTAVALPAGEGWTAAVVHASVAARF